MPAEDTDRRRTLPKKYMVLVLFLVLAIATSFFVQSRSNPSLLYLGPTATPQGGKSATLTSLTPTPGPDGLIWSDEFDEPADTEPDPDKWNPDVGGNGWGNEQLEYNTRNSNAYHDGDGNLVLEARQEDSRALRCWYGRCDYTSARITTNERFAFTYGRIVGRMKVPSGQGIWPAFWMLGADMNEVGWPNNGEIDIMEYVGQEPARIYATVHGPDYSGEDGFSGEQALSDGGYADDYHIYEMRWTSSRISFFVDGVQYHTVDRSTVEEEGDWVFDSPFYVILNVAVGGDWPGDPDDSIFPQEMLVDYVRVYNDPTP